MSEKNSEFSLSTQNLKILMFLAIFLTAFFSRILHLDERMTHCDDTGVMFSALYSANAMENGDRVSSFWTYAPGQFILTTPFLKEAREWAEAVYMGRLPSALFGILAVLLTFFVTLISAKKSSNILASLLATTLVTTSIYLVLHSQQMYPYMITAPFLLVTFTYFLHSLDFKTKSFKSLFIFVLYALWAGLSVWANYIMIVPALGWLGCATLFYLVEKRTTNKKEWFFLVLSFIVSALLVYSLVKPLFEQYILRLVAAGKNIPGWAISESPSWAEAEKQNILGAVMYLRQYVSHLLRKFFMYDFAFVHPDIYLGSILSSLFGKFLCIVWIFGISSLLFTKTRKKLDLNQIKIGFFCFLLSSAFLVGNLLGKFPLGTTRHSIPFFICNVYLVYLGCFFIVSLIKKEKELTYAVTLINFTILGLFWLGYRPFHLLTKNNLPMDWIETNLNVWKVKEVAGSACTYDQLSAAVAIKKSNFAMTGSSKDASFSFSFDRLDKEELYASVLFINHRYNHFDSIQEAVRSRPQLKAELIYEKHPSGRNEIFLDNGGNGGYVTKVTKILNLTEKPKK